MITFSPGEIFQMAVQIERDGVAFYLRAAQQVDDAALAEALRGLADMEGDHEKTFTAMAAELSASEKADSVFDPDEEEAYYLQSMVDGKVFAPRSGEAGELAEGLSVEQILRKAIQREQDSILFYLGLKDAVVGERGRRHLDKIIREEMGHVGLLRRQLAG